MLGTCARLPEAVTLAPKTKKEVYKNGEKKVTLNFDGHVLTFASVDDLNVFITRFRSSVWDGRDVYVNNRLAGFVTIGEDR